MSIQSQYFAAIDLGSNSFHLLVVRKSDDKVEIVDREKEMVQLARGLRQDGDIEQDVQDKALNCLQRFSERIKDIPRSHIRAVGTKALRASKNADRFLHLARKSLGVPIQVISGFEEARLVYKGFSHSVTDNKRQRLVIDIGGGSTEFVVGLGERTLLLESLAIGCVTFSTRFFPESIEAPYSKTAIRGAQLAACSELEAILKKYKKQGWELAYGTSGTMRAAAELLKSQDGGAVITRDSLFNCYQSFLSSGEINLPASIGERRRSVLPAGICIIHAIFEQLDLEKIHIADASLKEGLVYDTIGRFGDKDARVGTVKYLQSKYNVDMAQAERVRKTAKILWRQVGGPDLIGVSRTKMLSWAADLHEIGLSISHADYHRHGHYLIRNSDLAGFGRYEQAILANLVRAQRKKIVWERFSELDADALAAFIPLMLCLRLAIVLHRRREDVSELPRLTRDEDGYSLLFDGAWLQERPLTRAGLEQEIAYLSNLNLKIEQL